MRADRADWGGGGRRETGTNYWGQVVQNRAWAWAPTRLHGFCLLLGTEDGWLPGPLSLGPAFRTSDWSKEGCGTFHPTSPGSVPVLREAPCISLLVPSSSVSGEGLIEQTWLHMRHRPRVSLVKSPKSCLESSEEGPGHASLRLKLSASHWAREVSWGEGISFSARPESAPGGPGQRTTIQKWRYNVPISEEKWPKKCKFRRWKEKYNRFSSNIYAEVSKYLQKGWLGISYFNLIVLF